MTSSPPLPAARSPWFRPGVAAGAALLLVVAGCGGPDELRGTVVTASTTDQDDQPRGGGRLAVLDDDGLRDFLGAAGIDTPPEEEIPYLAGRVRRDDVTRAGGSLVTIDDKGEFTLTTTGRRTICLLAETPQVDLLRGCVNVDLPASGTLSLTVSTEELTAELAD